MQTTLRLSTTTHSWTIFLGHFPFATILAFSILLSLSSIMQDTCIALEVSLDRRRGYQKRLKREGGKRPYSSTFLSGSLLVTSIASP